MTPARMRRLSADFEEVKKNFNGHRYIFVTPIGDEPPEKYHVIYYVKGIYLLPDGKIATQERHEVDIFLHAEYPRYKPICRISTPIWHPNFRDGQICIGDIWGAGESLSDVIINIGDMIQYKSWNAYSPLNSEAAQWAMENKQLFPIDHVDLFYADNEPKKEAVEIDLLDQKKENLDQNKVNIARMIEEKMPSETDSGSERKHVEEAAGPVNDFEITAEELEGVTYVPTAERMQTVSHGGLVKGNKVNFKTILVKGLLWALIGTILGVALTELTKANDNHASVAKLFGYTHLSDYYKYDTMADEEFHLAFQEFTAYCAENNYDASDSDVFKAWYTRAASSEAQAHLSAYLDYDEKADDAVYDSYCYEFNKNEDALIDGLATVGRCSTALWSGLIALFIGLALGVGEGVYYGSKEKAIKYAALGAGISLLMGFISGYLAQWMYSELLGDDPALFEASLIRALGWGIMGIGVGLAIGLIKPGKRRILFCSLGGLIGAFLGGFLFNYICEIIPDDIVARVTAIVIMGVLIGVGVGLLEQFAKQAWLKVIRGEFEGKEYLVFAGTTSIGNNGKNTIVLFKDKLVGAHHCDIILEGSKYTLVDCGTPMGTVVNGMKITRRVLNPGDAIAIGNSVLVFNTK